MNQRGLRGIRIPARGAYKKNIIKILYFERGLQHVGLCPKDYNRKPSQELNIPERLLIDVPKFQVDDVSGSKLNHKVVPSSEPKVLRLLFADNRRPCVR